MFTQSESPLGYQTAAAAAGLVRWRAAGAAAAAYDGSVALAVIAQAGCFVIHRRCCYCAAFVEQESLEKAIREDTMNLFHREMG